MTEISLMIGHPDPATLTTPELQAAVEQILHSRQFYRALQYGPEHGTPDLITYLVDKLNRDQTLNLKHENLMLVAGSTAAVDMITRLFARGRTVMVESPTYADALHIFRDHAVELCAIPVDDQGMSVAALSEQLSRLHREAKTPAFLYTIPTYQNPSGATLPLERRQAILKLARQYGFLIVEDDVYRDLAFEDIMPPSFYALSGGQGVISIGSFSKTLAPGLRLGWIVAAPELINQCVNCGTTQMGGGATPFSAQIVSEYCRAGHWDAHIASLRANYRTRRDVLLSALTQHMPAGVSWTQPNGGFFVWLRLPENIYAPAVKQAALARGVTLSAGNGYFVDPRNGDHALRLTYSFAPLADLETGVKVIGDVIRELSAASELLPYDKNR